MKTFCYTWGLMAGASVLTTAVMLGLLDMVTMLTSGMVFWKAYVALVVITSAIIAACVTGVDYEVL